MAAGAAETAARGSARAAAPAQPAQVADAGTASSPPFGVLVVTATAGYRHDSIAAAVAAIRRWGEASGSFHTTVLAEVADLPALDGALLAQQRVLCFANTSGDLPLSAAQQRAIVEFVAAGGGFAGTHSAADTGYAWPEYGDLIGAYFREHPWTQRVTVRVEDGEHPAARELPPTFDIEDEIYVFRTDPGARPQTRVLLSLDPASVGAAGGFPLAWCAPYGAGRTFYTALGHFDAVWEDPLFATHLARAIEWAAGA
jgi:type 1 glutamine amidotransferase